MSKKSNLTSKFMGNLMLHHFCDEHCQFFSPQGAEINENYLFPLKDSLAKEDYARFEELLFSEVDNYAYESYQNGFKDGVRHVISMMCL